VDVSWLSKAKPDLIISQVRVTGSWMDLIDVYVKGRTLKGSAPPQLHEHIPCSHPHCHFVQRKNNGDVFDCRIHVNNAICMTRQ
jgi:hypothetical protein